MSKASRGVIYILGLLPLLLPATGQGFTFNFPPGSNRGYQQPPPAGYNYRPQPPSNARGAPPGYPPARPYGYGQPQQARPSAMEPQLELELSDKKPYVQENTILTLRVISGSNLKTVDPILPQNQSASFQKVKNITARSRVVRGQQQIVNEIVYMVTPLRAGTLELPVSVNVVTANGYSRSMTLEAKQPLRLEAQPAQLGVTPWLPLEQLAITTNLGPPVDVEPGKPVTLVVKLSAAGTIGSQLPSLERALQTPDFRIYREKTETEGGLSQNGRHIMGTRTEHYTLVPQYSGKLRLPAARVTWFNVNSGSVERSTLPIKTLAAVESGEGGMGELFGGKTGALSSFTTATLYWLLPLLGITLLMIGYWLGLRYKSRGGGRPSPGLGFLIPLSAAVSDAARFVVSAVRNRTGRALGKLNPAPYWNRILVRAGTMLPTPVRFWFWVRCANDEKDPALWCKTLQFLSCRQLALSPYAPLPKMAERIIRFQRSSDPEKMRKLFKELDGAIYGKETIDFERWKQDFNKQVRPSLFGLTAGSDPAAPRRQNKLPELNPKAV